MDLSTLEWTAGAIQPFYRGYNFKGKVIFKIHVLLRNAWTRFSTIQRDEDTFYVVGGNQSRPGNSRKILKYEGDVWSHVGDLQIARHSPALAFNGNELIIIGGWADGYRFPDNDAT